MSETLRVLERLAYLSRVSDSVRDRRELDELLKATETSVDDQEVEESVAEEVNAV